MGILLGNPMPMYTFNPEYTQATIITWRERHGSAFATVGSKYANVAKQTESV